MASILDEIKDSVITGTSEGNVEELTRIAIDDGLDPIDILNQGLIAGINIIGERWKKGDAFIPEVLWAANAMRPGMNVLKEKLVKGGMKPLGKVIIGTVKADVHDIGKNLVAMMMESFGFEVTDLGVDVAPEKFIEMARSTDAQLVCMSALLTTTMLHIKDTISAIREAELGVLTMVGGAPVDQAYADKCGADAYAPDAITAVDKAKEIIGIRKV